MKEHSPVMPATASHATHWYLQGKHTRVLLLVSAVLLVHLWLLSDYPLWFFPSPNEHAQTTAFVTRQIQVPARPTSKPIRPVFDGSDAANTSADSPARPDDGRTTSDVKFDEMGTDLSATLGLPARSASAVDLPPYKTPIGADGLTQVTAFKAPASTRMKYQVQGKVKGFDYWASAELLWKQDGLTYEAMLEVSAFLLGSRVQLSQGQLGSEGLMPVRFGDKNRSELAAHFQRDKGIISFSANSPDAMLLKGAQDRLSVVMQLSALLAGDPSRFPLGTMLSFQTVSQREAEIWHFLVDKEELLTLPYGSFHTVKLYRKPRREFDQHIELWFAPDLAYLPVRLRITNANGDSVDQLLRSMETLSP